MNEGKRVKRIKREQREVQGEKRERCHERWREREHRAPNRAERH